MMDGEKRGKAYPFGAAAALGRVGRVYSGATERKYRVSEDEEWFEEAATKELIPWFRTCWLAAGGKAFVHRAMLAPHDARKRLNLAKGSWTARG